MIAFNELKSVAKVLQEAGKIEQYQQILDAQKDLLEMQKKIIDLEADNKKLREELEIKEGLIPDGSLYWIIKNGKKDGPFCTCCWDSEHKLIRLHKIPHFDIFNCPKCKTTVNLKGMQTFSQTNNPINRAI